MKYELKYNLLYRNKQKKMYKNKPHTHIYRHRHRHLHNKQKKMCETKPKLQTVNKLNT